MALIKQFAIIFSIYSISDIFYKSLKLPIPANVIGMLILFILLITGIIKEHHIDKASDILIGNMSLLFVPATLAIMEEYKYIKEEIGKSRKEFEMINDNVKSKKVNIDRAYLFLRDLENGVEKKDKTMFFLKYKNAIQELNML